MEGGEIHRVGPLDHGDDEAAAAILSLHVHGQAEGDAFGNDAVGRAVPHRERVPHDGVLLRGLHQREGDEVGIGDLLGPARRSKRLVERAPAIVEHPDRHHPHRSGSGHGQAFVHVRDQPGRGALDGRGARRHAIARGRRDRRSRSGGRRRRWCRPVSLRPLADDAALEQPAPVGAYGRRITEELLVHRLREARVGRLEHVRVHRIHHPLRVGVTGGARLPRASER